MPIYSGDYTWLCLCIVQCWFQVNICESSIWPQATAQGLAHILQASEFSLYTLHSIYVKFHKCSFSFFMRVSATMVKQFWKKCVKPTANMTGFRVVNLQKKEKERNQPFQIFVLSKRCLLVLLYLPNSKHFTSKSNVKPVICYCKTEPACIIWY